MSADKVQIMYNEFIAYIRRICDYVMSIYHCDAQLPKHMPMVYLEPDQSMWLPSTDCGDTAGGIAFEIYFDAYPDFILCFTTHSVCEILYSFGDELTEAAKHEILSRINRAFLQYIYNEANRTYDN